MAVLTIRDVDESVKARLRTQAARRGHSMEEEARQILARGVRVDAGEALGSGIARRFASLGGVELPALDRSPPRLTLDLGASRPADRTTKPSQRAAARRAR